MPRSIAAESRSYSRKQRIERKCPGAASRGIEQKAARRWAAFRENGLLTETQLLQQVVVLRQILALDVVEELATAGGHLEKTTAAVEVLAMRAQVLGQMIDPGGEQ